MTLVSLYDVNNGSTTWQRLVCGRSWAYIGARDRKQTANTLPTTRKMTGAACGGYEGSWGGSRVGQTPGWPREGANTAIPSPVRVIRS